MGFLWNFFFNISCVFEDVRGKNGWKIVWCGGTRYFSICMYTYLFKNRKLIYERNKEMDFSNWKWSYKITRKKALFIHSSLTHVVEMIFGGGGCCELNQTQLCKLWSAVLDSIFLSKTCLSALSDCFNLNCEKNSIGM